jgi:hypothetical protein
MPRRCASSSRDGEGAEAPGPDFSHVDSQKKAQELADRGELARLHPVPPEFGGTGDVRNVVHVPRFVVGLKHDVDANVVLPLIEEGTVRSYAATAQYDGPSFVPCSIAIRASDPGGLPDNDPDLGTGAHRGSLTGHLGRLGITPAGVLL